MMLKNLSRPSKNKPAEERDTTNHKMKSTEQTTHSGEPRPQTNSDSSPTLESKPHSVKLHAVNTMLPQNNAQFDKSNTDDAILHVNLLGHTDHFLKVRLRFIKGTGDAKNISGFSPEQVESYLNLGYSPYVIPNSAQTTVKLKEVKWFVVEWDDISKDEQLDKFEKVFGRKPTFQVDTGNKSIHNYLKLAVGHTNIGEAAQLSKDIIAALKADKNASSVVQPMRLAGYPHPKTGQLAKVINPTGNEFTFEELRAFFPTSYTSHETNCNGKVDPALIEEYLKALTPEFMDDYVNWIQVGQCLHSTGDDSWLAAWDEVSKISTKYEPGACERKWSTFNESNGLTISSLAHFAKDCGWISGYKQHVEAALEAASEPMERKAGRPVHEEGQRNRRKTKVEIVEEIQEKWGNRLRLNEMDRDMYLDGKILDTEILTVIVSRELGLELNFNNAREYCLAVAKENQWSPVRDYLLKVEKDFAEFSDHFKACPIQKIATKYLSTDNLLYDKYLMRTMIAAVARVFEPGCKVDTVPILIGAQGIGKSSFWETLFGARYFNDDFKFGDGVDELVKLRNFWCVELGEIDYCFRKEAVETLKKRISTRTDNYRLKYAHKNTNNDRTSIFVATSNREDLLQDETGERRWI